MSPERYIFRRQRKWYSSPLYIFVLTGLILSGLFITQGFRRGEMKPLFLPTPTPTRQANSYQQEAETHFQAGNLDAAIRSYQDAISINTNNGRLYAELARILTYSTESQTTDTAKQDRFDQAMTAAKKAIELAPDDSTAYAVLAFTQDWYSSFVTIILQDQKGGTKLLTEAEQSISRAITLDETNVLAQVYRAEILIDQQRFDQAKDALDRALKGDPNLWDVHRVYGLYLENMGDYTGSIDEFKRAVDLAPNMTFLYIKLGQSYRNLGMRTNSEVYYKQSIDYFALAVAQNEQLNIKDPLPYLGIGRVYAQLGEFFAASRNMSKAIQYKPTDPQVYAQLGMVYRQARNYEDAIKALKCAVRGCDDKITCDLRQCNPDIDPPITITGMKLSGTTLVYYYTYASLLAGMWLPGDPDRKNYCNDSMTLISEIRSSSFGSDQTITSILNESESICSGARSQPSSQSTNEAKPTPTPMRTPTLLPTPKMKPTQ